MAAHSQGSVKVLVQPKKDGGFQQSSLHLR